MPEDNARKSMDKSRRAVILATVGIAVIMGLAVFYVAVVAPFLRTRRLVIEYAANDNWDWSPVPFKATGRLGGEERNTRALISYLRWPKWLSPERDAAVGLLAQCGKSGIPTLIAVVRDKTEDDKVRLVAVNHLHWLEPVERLSPRPVAVVGMRFTDTDVMARRVYTALPDNTEIERIIKAACEANDLQYEPPEPHD